jgi:hypothetical protein
VILEYETQALYCNEEMLDRERTIDLILSDLEQARRSWDRAYGAASRRTTRRAMA